ARAFAGLHEAQPSLPDFLGRPRRPLSWLEVVGDARRGRAAVALQLRLDPVDRIAVALRALAAVAKLRQPLDRRLVLRQVQATDEGRDRIGGGGRYRVGRRDGCA